LRIYKNSGDKDTSATLLNTADIEKFCPRRTKILFENPSRCEATATRYRTYFPKYGNQVIGGYDESLVDGLYFQHIFRGGRFLWSCFIVACMTIASAFGIAMYWWLSRKDPVGASNIGSCFIAFGMLLVAVLCAIPLFQMQGH